MTLEKQFKKHFKDGMEFWTSEDGRHGTLISIAVCFTPNWPKVLRERVISRNPGKAFKRSRVKVRYAFKKGKVWEIGDDPTPFQVCEYEFSRPDILPRRVIDGRDVVGVER